MEEELRKKEEERKEQEEQKKKEEEEAKKKEEEEKQKRLKEEAEAEEKAQQKAAAKKKELEDDFDYEIDQKPLPYKDAYASVDPSDIGKDKEVKVDGPSISGDYSCKTVEYKSTKEYLESILLYPSADVFFRGLCSRVRA